LEGSRFKVTSWRFGRFLLENKVPAECKNSVLGKKRPKRFSPSELLHNFRLKQMVEKNGEAVLGNTAKCGIFDFCPKRLLACP
jgi:hypothetical protein